MDLRTRRLKFLYFSFLKHDFRASITVFFVAFPLCLGIALASGVPVYSGLLSGIIGGLVVTLFSKSELSVSGPAAGLTAICAGAILELGAIEIFFLSVSLAGLLQILLGLFKLGGFTHLIPSSVIKGMLAAIGILLISKQIPLLIGYDQPDFWRKELFNIFTFNHAFTTVRNLYQNLSLGAVLTAGVSFLTIYTWKKTAAKRYPSIPTSILAVLTGTVAAIILGRISPGLQLLPAQFVSVPDDVFSQVSLPDFSALFTQSAIWETALIICLVASLETLLSIEAIDKLDPQNRITPQNRELVAQGIGNTLSGLLGGLPITAVIVRSSANAEAGARTKLSSMAHGLWILLAIALALPLIRMIPYAVLAVILIRTGYNLAKPAMIRHVYQQGREQFLPFIVTVGAILFTDLLFGVLIGIGYAFYFLVKHTYRAGYRLEEKTEGHTRHFMIDLALNVSFLNKKRISDLLDKIPEYAIVEIDGSGSYYIDHDILEIVHDFKSKARRKHIQLILHNIPDIESIELH